MNIGRTPCSWAVTL